jgi:peptide/nickel transport system ATP-binding protein
LTASAADLRRRLGRRISYVPQNPGASLNPATPVGFQIAEILRAHGLGGDDVDRDVDALLANVALPTGTGFRRRYPHQLSGGQQQRIALAIALACKPAVVVLDEPTTGLDVTTEAQILTLIDKLRRELGTALFYVTHNLAVIGGIADRVAVVYGGALVELGPKAEIFERPRHPYTRSLIKAIPTLDGPRRRLVGIPGSAAGAGGYGVGCTFVARCAFRQPRCNEPQPSEFVGPAHVVRCVRWRELVGALDTAQSASALVTPVDPATASLLVIRDLTATYRQRGRSPFIAVHHASLNIRRGECVAIVGESGSGKSTLARCVAGLHERWTGEIRFDGMELPAAARQRSADVRRRIQIVFQNPDRSLNPYHAVRKIVARPCRQLRGMSARAAERRALELLEQVRLPRRYAQLYPVELSGGERQRVAIARALAADAELLVCDEITSALDVSVQASLLELLEGLRRQYALSLLFISHDLSVVRAVADRIVVMRDGVVRENRATEEILSSPEDAYTKALLAAAPRVPQTAAV